MLSMGFSDLLAQLPETTVYISVGKLVAQLALFSIWLLFAQWVDKDAVVVNTWRVPWNLATLGAGVPAILLMLLIPNFWIGLACFFVITAVELTIYIIHRNGLVTEDTVVFTPSHISRIMSQGFGRKQKLREVKERVKLKGADRKSVAIPTEPVERDQYAATQELLFDALWRRASFVNMVPAGQATKVTYEIDGMTVDREGMARPDGDAVLGYLKKLAGLNLEERRKPQIGTFSAAVGETSLQIEVHTGGSTVGEKLMLRAIGVEAGFKTPDLGFTPEQLAALQELIHTPKGVVIFSGPAKSGLSTTVYSVVRTHDAFLNNIQTVEFRKEYTLDNVTQHVFKPAEDKTFAKELQRIVRTDPDMIVVPEFRDADAAPIACHAADHKQKVYVALAGDDCYDALKTWLTMVNDKALLASSLLAVFNQRLVRKLCNECKQAYKPPPAQLQKANLPQDKVFYRPPDQQFDKHGNPIVCQNCHGTGYVGRTAIFEILLIDDGLRDVIKRGGTVADIKSYDAKRGAGGLQQQALSKVLDGTTSIQEVIRVTRKAAPAAQAAPKPAASAT